jgi:hypothetical protein
MPEKSDCHATPLACRLDAFSAEERRRYDELRSRLDAATEEVSELEDGFVFRYRPEPRVFEAAAEWITLERKCCPFVRFNLEWHDDQPAPRLRMTGRSGVKEILRAALRPDNTLAKCC